jgi:hypothetical protein
MVTAPALFGDLIERLAIGRVDLDIVGRLNDRRALAQRLRRLRPQLVIIGLHESETEALISVLLTRLPGSKFIVLSHDGRSIAGYERRLNRTPLPNLSPEGLFDFIRTAPDP